MIEYLEEHILSSRLRSKELYVIYDKYIYLLIEMNKVSTIIVFSGYWVLFSKILSFNI